MSTGGPTAGPGHVASAIDAIGNAVLISGLTLGEAAYALIPGRYPLQCLPALIHETAHFDTFQTPVGHALAALYLRAWSEAARYARGIREEGRDLNYESVVDLVRFKIASAALLPLAEGMALFAEFDAFPGSSPVTTPMTRLVATAFGGDIEKLDDAITVGARAQTIMNGARRLSFFEARKENLITQPLSVDGGGYLPGYVLLKGIRELYLKQGFVDVIDGDLFFTIVKAIVFGDMRLARLILDPTLDLMFSSTPDAVKRDAVNAVLSRIQERIIGLITQVNGNYIRRLEKFVAQPHPFRWLDLQLESDSATAEEDALLVSEQIDTLCNDPRYANDDISHTCYRVLINRDLLCLASFETQIEVKPGGRCLIGSMQIYGETFPVTALPSLDGIAPVRALGSFEIYLSSTESTIYYCAVIDDQLVAWGNAGGSTKEVPDIAVRAPSVRGMLKLRQQMERDLAGAYEPNSYAGVVKHYIDQIPEMVRHIYFDRVEAIVELEYGGRISEMLEHKGILEFCNADDLVFMSAYSRLALRTSGITMPDKFEEECTWARVEPARFRDWLNSWAARTGFPLITELNTVLYFTL